MTKIKLTYKDLNAPYKCISYAEELHSVFCDLTDARRYFCADELEESKKQFINDLMQGEKQHYIDFLKNEIEEIKPAGLYGAYDFGLIREYETLINKIENF